MLIAGIVAAAGLLLTIATLPEPRGMSLEQIEKQAYQEAPAKVRVRAAPRPAQTRLRSRPRRAGDARTAATVFPAAACQAPARAYQRLVFSKRGFQTALYSTRAGGGSCLATARA